MVIIVEINMVRSMSESLFSIDTTLKEILDHLKKISDNNEKAAALIQKQVENIFGNLATMAASDYDLQYHQGVKDQEKRLQGINDTMDDIADLEEFTEKFKERVRKK